MKKFLLSAILVIALVGVSLLLLLTRDAAAHQTDVPHLDSYDCQVNGSDLLCKIKIHNPTWMGTMCPHNVTSSYLRRVLKFGSAQGCDIWAYFRPIPPQRAWIATLYVRDLAGAVLSQHGLSWSAVPPPTPTPTPTPAPAEPYYTGYQCNWQYVYHCYAWMYIPESYTNTYYGGLESADFLWGGYEYDEPTRTWTIEMFFKCDVTCGQFGRLWVREGGTDRLLDSMYMDLDCEAWRPECDEGEDPVTQ